MAQQIGNEQSTREVGRTSEQMLSVASSNSFIHQFSMEINKEGVFTVSVKDLLKDWIAGKGQVKFESVEVTAKFSDAGGDLYVGFCAEGASLVTVTDALTWPNNVHFGSNAYNTGNRHVETLMPPMGYDVIIFPATGPLPMPSLFIASGSIAKCRFTMALKVSASGPYVHRYTLNWNDVSSLKPQVGFR